MNHYTKTGTATIAPGMTLSVRGGALHIGDSLDLNTPDDSRHQVLIQDIGAECLIFLIEGKRAICRPWRAGDPGLYRLPGTSSNWVVERMDENALTGAD